MIRSRGSNRLSRTKKHSLVWPFLLAAAPGALAEQADSIPTIEGSSRHPRIFRSAPGAADDGDDTTRLAQFQLPRAPSGDQVTPAGDVGTSRYPERPLISRLKYQFSYGSESDISYRRNPDLDSRLRDNFLIASPQINGLIVYRPTDRVELGLEMILQRDIVVHEEPIVVLPDGQTQLAPRRYTSLPIDQAWITFKDLGPGELTLGRRNFEDDRHWLYDTSLDVALAHFKQGTFQADVSVSRKDRLDLDLTAPVKKTRTDNYMVYASYRGIEDIKLAGYTIFQEDQTGNEGQPLHMGLRASGNPSDRFNFWTELAVLRGKDETKKNFKGYAFDLGGTYRFPHLPYAPNITLGYAYATGDGNPRDNINHEFRQTGLQSNEGRLGGISRFKYYGEALDPELSNLQIATAAFGIRPAPNVSLELVFHHYRLNDIAGDIRNPALTAQINQDPTRPSKELGNGLDIVLGFRNLFGVRRLGLDLRMGWFFPRRVFNGVRAAIDPATGEEITIPRKANTGISVLAKFWF